MDTVVLINFLFTCLLLGLLLGLFTHFVIRKLFGERGVQFWWAILSMLAAATMAATGHPIAAGLWFAIALLRGFLAVHSP